MRLKISIASGLLMGSINCIAWYLLALKMGFYSDKYYGYRLLIMFGFILIGVFFTIVIAKRKDNGFIEFKETLRVGMLFSIILAAVLALFNYIYHTYITPDTIDFFVSEVQKMGVAHHKAPKDVEMYVKIQKESFSSYRLFPPALFSGLIVSLLSGAILQKSNVNKEAKL